MTRSSCVALLLIAGCGSASEGAAAVHGKIFSGEAASETSFEFTAPAEVHGAGPFRIFIAISQPVAGTDPSGTTAFVRSIEIIQPRLPTASGRIALDEEFGVRAEVRALKPGPDQREGAPDGKDFRFSDGSFILRPEQGWFELDLSGRKPGDGVTGTFELTVRTTGEKIRGTFAAALAD